MKRCKFAPRYEVISATFQNEDIGAYIGFGIQGCRRNYFGGKDVIRVVNDVSVDRDIVQGMVELFNMCCLSVEFLEDMVIDLIS